MHLSLPLFQFCQCHFDPLPAFLNFLHAVGKGKTHTFRFPEGIPHYRRYVCCVEQVHREICCITDGVITISLTIVITHIREDIKSPFRLRTITPGISFTISSTLERRRVNSSTISIVGRRSVVSATTAAFWVIELVPLVNWPCIFSQALAISA